MIEQQGLDAPAMGEEGRSPGRNHLAKPIDPEILLTDKVRQIPPGKMKGGDRIQIAQPVEQMRASGAKQHQIRPRTGLLEVAPVAVLPFLNAAAVGMHRRQHHWPAQPCFQAACQPLPVQTGTSQRVAENQHLA